VARNAAKDEQVRQHVDDVVSLQSSVDPDRDAFARELVDDVQHPIFPAIMGAILDEVVGPDMVGMLRPQPHARAVVQPEPPPFGLFGRDLQPLASPDPRHPFGVHPPAPVPQHRRDPTIAVTAVLDGERRDVGRQGRLIIGPAGFLALRGTVLAQNPASEPLGDAMFGDHMLHAGAATRGA